ncbi:MAG: site-2 protease family protein [Candidatus Bathyarchaeota archaeon]
MVEPYIILLALLTVWTAVYISSMFLPFKKYGIEATPLYMLFKTERFNKLLSRIAEKNQRFWRIFGNIGIIAAALEIPLALYYLASNLQRFIYIPTEASPIVPVLPGITISFEWVPYILIAIGLAITSHEMAHGILSFLEKIPVKSSGIIIAPITFGGFVEPDQEVFDKSRLSSKLRVLASGSLTNLVIGFLTLLLLIALFVPSSGVLVMAVPESGPAYAAGIRQWDVIYSINGHDTRNVGALTQYMVAVGPGAPLTLVTSRGLKSIVTIAAPENSSRGIMYIQNLVDYTSMRVGEVSSQISYHLFMTLNWTYLLMISLSIFNMLPLFPFDGEACIYSILKAKLKTGLKVSRIAINALSLFLLVSNIGLTFIRYGLTPL